MKCQHCGKNEATVQLRQSINGQLSEYALCSHCAEQLGVGGMFADFGSFGGFGGFGGMGLMGGMDPFAGFESLLGSMLGAPRTGTLPQTRRCSLCGSSFDDIANRGKLGCAECYEQFGDRLAPTIERMHGRTKHIGKLPGRPAAPNNPIQTERMEKKKEARAADTLEELRNQLRMAVAAEEYEKAAVLRDRIKEMENR